MFAFKKKYFLIIESIKDINLRNIKKHNKLSTIIIFDVPFNTRKFIETCSNKAERLENKYFVDHADIVRKSVQYHGPALRYLTVERLDR